jgi:hypothetical protein
MGMFKKLAMDKDYKICNVKVNEEEEKKRKTPRDEMEKNMKTYIELISSIPHSDFIPIKSAVNKYREQLNRIWQKGDIGNSDKWVLSSIMRLSKILLISKIKNRWVCSKQRLDNFDFNKFDVCWLGNLLCVNNAL